MTVSASRPRYLLRFQASRDWPLAGAAVSAFLSFVMLFPPWLTGGDDSQNAFGDALQSAGPALIIVMVLATIALLGIAVATVSRRYLTAAVVPSSILLAVYVVKVADVSDLADLYTKLAGSLGGGVSVGTGAGLWIGFVFALLTLLFVLLALGLKWGRGDALVFPASFRAPREPGSDAPPDISSGYPPPPKDPPDSTDEPGSR